MAASRAVQMVEPLVLLMVEQKAAHWVDWLAAWMAAPKAETMVACSAVQRAVQKAVLTVASKELQMVARWVDYSAVN